MGIGWDDDSKSGGLINHAGRVRRILPAPGGLRVEVAHRHGAVAHLTVDRVVNCTGRCRPERSCADAG